MRILDCTSALAIYLTDPGALGRYDWHCRFEGDGLRLIYRNLPRRRVTLFGIPLWWSTPQEPLCEVWNGQEVHIPTAMWAEVYPMVLPFLSEFEANTGKEITILKVYEFTD
jgi:hypothetical protein